MRVTFVPQEQGITAEKEREKDENVNYPYCSVLKEREEIAYLAMRMVGGGTGKGI